MNENTRIWWDGSLAQFVRWTEKGLVFHWGDPNETAIHMPRGAVIRLMAKGTLEIEGYLPDWAYGQQTHPHRSSHDPVLHEAAAPKMSKKLSIIARLINKLGGGDPARATN